MKAINRRVAFNSSSRKERNHREVATLFAKHGYPPPHPLVCRLYSDAAAKASILAANDVKVPVIVRKQTGQIVDGINRCERLLELGVAWKDVPKRVLDLPTDHDVVECIAKCNFDRGQYNKSQLAILAVRLGLCEFRQGARTDLGKNCRKLAGVSPKYLRHARCVIERGASELVMAIMNDEIKVAEAAIVADELSNEQQIAVYVDSRTGNQTFKAAAGNAVSLERAKKLTANCARLPDVVAQVVHIDPPWKGDRESSLDSRHTAFHYPVMTNEEIMNVLQRVKLAPNAWIFMWTLPCHRDDAIAMLRALGFDRFEEIIWSKTVGGKKIVFGKGHVVRHTHEILLICRRGNPPLPPTDSRPPSVIEADVESHSRKPDLFRNLIIRMTPNLVPRVELFARGKPYPGFIAWGNQVTPLVASKEETPPFPSEVCKEAA